MSQDRPNERVIQLQQGNPDAWTHIIRYHDVDNVHLKVNDVQVERINELGARYYLSLHGHSDPITLIGRTATLREIRFHHHLSPQMPLLASHCWFTPVSYTHLTLPTTPYV